MIRGVVFDLDDTLYLEREYVRSGFAEVAGFVAARTGVDADRTFEFLWNGFETSRRGRAFDELIEAFALDGLAVGELVAAYRAHQPDIALATDVRALLMALRSDGRKIGVITDGPAESQHAKVAALGLLDLVDLIVVTGEWGEDFWKPHPRSYDLIEETWGLPGSDLTYVGDNPAKDFVTARRRGWLTVRVRRAGQLHLAVEATDEYRADHEVTDLAELLPLISAGSRPA